MFLFFFSFLSLLETLIHTRNKFCRHHQRSTKEKKKTQTKFTISTNHSTLMKKHIHLNNLLYLFRSLEFYKTKRNDECASVSIKRKQLYETRNNNKKQE